MKRSSALPPRVDRYGALRVYELIYEGEKVRASRFSETVCPHLKIGEYYHNVFRLIYIGITDQIRTDEGAGEWGGGRREAVRVRAKSTADFPPRKISVC